jgi:hypothetical protein
MIVTDFVFTVTSVTKRRQEFWPKNKNKYKPNRNCANNIIS